MATCQEDDRLDDVMENIVKAEVCSPRCSIDGNCKKKQSFSVVCCAIEMMENVVVFFKSEEKITAVHFIVAALFEHGFVVRSDFDGRILGFVSSNLVKLWLRVVYSSVCTDQGR